MRDGEISEEVRGSSWQDPGFSSLAFRDVASNEQGESMRYKPCFCGRREPPLRRHRGVPGMRGSHHCSRKIQHAELPKFAKLSWVWSCTCLGSNFCPSLDSSQRQYPTHSVHCPLPSQHSPSDKPLLAGKWPHSVLGKQGDQSDSEPEQGPI